MRKALGLRCSRMRRFARVWIPVVMVIGGCSSTPDHSKPRMRGQLAADASASGDADTPNDANGDADMPESAMDAGVTAPEPVPEPADAGSPVDAANAPDAARPSDDDDAGESVDASLDADAPVDEGEELVGWFVDSVYGNDANDGRSKRTAFATLNKLRQSPLTSGETTYLARGSFWRESLVGLPAGSEVRTYGSGPRPIIDGSDVAPNQAFRKTDGFTNVYEIAWTHDFTIDGGKTAHRVWENDNRLRRVLDLASCDATPGSFYAEPPTAGGPDTVYVHASDSSDISSNGQVYELTRRLWAVQLYTHREHAFVYGLHTRRNAHADGSLVVDGLISDCLAEDGRVHNIFIRGIAENSTAWKIEPPTVYGGATMFVTYEHLADLPGVVYRNCKAIGDGDAIGATGATNDVYTIGFYGHTSNGFKFGTAIYEECSTEGVVQAFGFSEVDNALYYKSNVKAGQESVGAVPYETLAVLGGNYQNRYINSGLVRYTSPATRPKRVIVRGVRVWMDSSYIQPLWIDLPGGDVEISRNTFILLGGGVFNFINGTFVVKNNVFYARDSVLYMAPNASYTIDQNLYYNISTSTAGRFLFQLGSAPLITGLAGWQTATGQDAQSVQADPLFLGAPASGEFALTPESPAVILGAGADFEGEELDEELQAHRRALLAPLGL